MRKAFSVSKKLTAIILCLIMLLSSFTVFAENGEGESNVYCILESDGKIICECDGKKQKNLFFFVSKEENGYSFDVDYFDSSVLYYFDNNGTGSAYCGIYGNKYYVNGVVELSGKDSWKIIDSKLYRISKNGDVFVYVKDKDKSGTYVKLVDGVCYNVSYKTGKVTLFTGVFDGNYYKKGVLAKANEAYYKVYNGKLYKVSKSAKASVYKKDSSKSGEYAKVVDGVCYSVSYKSGKVSKFTGVFDGVYYKSGSPAKANEAYYKVCNGKLYKISKSAKASVYKKDTSKSGEYAKIVDGVCYGVSYKTGAAKKYTGKYDGKFYKNGKLTDGWQTVGKKTYYCKKGVPIKGINKIGDKVYFFDSNAVKSNESGWKTSGGNKYYLSNGIAKTGWTMIGKFCYYFDKNAKLVTKGKVDGINVDSTGKATGPLKKLVPLNAKLIVASITKPSQKKSEKLRTCFDYVLKTYKSNGNPRIPHYTKEDWIYLYANDMYGERGGGNCFSYAAAFAFLAKECGYDEVYGCNSGGHGWVEIDGKAYDPEQYKDVGKKIYAMDYSTPMISHYKRAISAYKTNPWMYVRIPDIKKG